MLWVLFSVAILITLENYSSLRAKIPQLANPKGYFWLILNVVVLSYAVAALLPVIASFFDFLSVAKLVDLTQSAVYLQFIVFLIIIDSVKFGIHFLMHRNSFLWKIHSIHHSSTDINTLAAFKHSWLEAFFNLFLISLVSRILAVELPILTVTSTLMLSACIWQHTKIRYFAIPVLDAIVVTPKHHRIHHELRNDPNHKNYGLLFTVWDRLLGTFSKNEDPSPKYGIIEPSYPFESDLKQFFYPFYK